MSNVEPHMLIVRVPVTGEGERGSEAFWAVKPPEDTLSFKKQDGEWTEEKTLPAPWRIMGSTDVVVFDREGVSGLRAILEAIENEILAAEQEGQEGQDEAADAE